MSDPHIIEDAAPADESEDLVSLLQQEFGEIAAVLPGDAGDQCAWHALYSLCLVSRHGACGLLHCTRKYTESQHDTGVLLKVNDKEGRRTGCSPAGGKTRPSAPAYLAA